jgi:hypothetical protein
MSYVYNLAPADTPEWVHSGPNIVPFTSLSVAQLASIGWLPLIYDPPDSSLGYANPVAETRAGQRVAVAYALGTAEERAAVILRAQWLATALLQSQLDVAAARAILAVPLSVSPTRDDIQARIDALAILQPITAGI